jgi:ABC-2 type transport system permease protein
MGRCKPLFHYSSIPFVQVKSLTPMKLGAVTKFWWIFKLVWTERLVYRVNLLLEVLSSLFSSIILVFLWIAIYRSSAQDAIGGYQLGEMVTYILGGGLINTFILTTAENPETSQSIQDGTLSNLLIAPINPYAVWLVRDLGTKLFLFVVGLIGYIVVLFLFRGHLVFPGTPFYVACFGLSLLLAALLQFLVFEALSLLAFWIENTYGIRFTIRVIMEVVGGAIIPLSLFPELIRDIFLLLPFPFLIYLPMRIYLAKIPLSEIPFELLKEITWIGALALVNLVLWKRGLRQYVSMGD